MSTSYKKSWLLCWTGASIAMDRVNGALEAKKSDAEILRPLIECLWWICATDESLMEEYPSEWKVHLRPKGSDLYNLILGLRWARNRMAHQLCQWDIATSPFVWQDAEKLLPRNSVNKPNKAFDRGRNEFETLLQGTDPRDGLNRAIAEIKSKAIGSLPPKH